MLKKLLIVAVLVAGGAIIVLNANAELTLDEVVERHTEARGGAFAIEDMGTIELRVHLIEPTFEVDGHYRAMRDGRMRVDIFVDEQRVFSEGLDASPDGTEGWQLFGGEIDAVPTTAQGKAALERGVIGNLFGLHELGDLGYELFLRPREDVDGIRYHVIDTVTPDGFEKRYFINPETFLTERTREHSALHPDLDSEEHPHETVYFDFEIVDGVVHSLSTRKQEIDTGTTVQSSHVTSLEINTTFNENYFVAPHDR